MFRKCPTGVAFFYSHFLSSDLTFVCSFRKKKSRVLKLLLLLFSNRIQQINATQSNSTFRGIRLANTDGTRSITNMNTIGNSVESSPFEIKSSVSESSALLDSDSDSEDEILRMTGLDMNADCDMEIDESDTRSVSMATGITHDHPYAWALDGRVAGVNEGNSLPGHIHVSFNGVFRTLRNYEN